ncbi:MAG: efflux RND transporter permease subunit [Gemmatimonadaceae bacterium]|nr:efflux RND transporter permease subunit [Gemmatimonadaceae bacterium]
MGIAGRIARAFLTSKLTPLVTMASLAVGALGLMATPREEEPQISVPMVDVIVAMPGAGPTEVENHLARPLERRMWELPGVDHVYAMSGDGYAVVTVRFKVGEDQERSVVRVHSKLQSDMDLIPAGVLPPLVKPHAIDDVPILAITIHGGSDINALRQIALHLEDEVRTVADVAGTSVIGGQPREITVTMDATRLAAAGVTPGEVAMALQGANARLQAGEYSAGNAVVRVGVGAGLATAADVGRVVVSTRGGAPVYVASVATVSEGYGEPTNYVSHLAPGKEAQAAVTLQVAKRHGANATKVAEEALHRVEAARERLLPAGVTYEVTRNYGETAAEKAGELILHLIIATLSVTLLIGIFLGWREALVVLVAVPVTLALTLFAYYALGYTLNRITLFALIFSIGILVDDAIVVVENIYRHLQMGRVSAEDAAVEGVDEVGNPTILATFTVIAAILPMAFVSGMMGPYMRPIPVGASVAMLASLAVAFIVTPWLALRLLRGHVKPLAAPVEGREHEPEEASKFAKFYAGIMEPLMNNRTRRMRFYAGVGVLLLGSVALVGVKLVQVKMLPFDNKSEFQVVLDFPEGTALETSQAAARQIAEYLRGVPEVTHTQVYAGTSAPFNFNGLVRHYFMRRGANVADLQVNLKPKGERSRQSHDIAVAVRPAVDSIARLYGARAKVAEIPPGPPVLSTLVAEIYAPTDSLRVAAAEQVKQVMETTPGVVDVDWSIDAPGVQRRFRVDRVRAAQDGASVEQIARTLVLALNGMPVTGAMAEQAREGVAITPRLAARDRSSASALLGMPVATAFGPRPLARYVSVDSMTIESTRMRRNLRPVVYVTGDVAGSVEAPVYAILAMNERIDSLRVNGAQIHRYNATQPDRLDEVALKWDGEWQVTIDVFRDLGIAFAIVLLLIYVLVVGWFQSFSIPLVIMAPIPLTLIGILPGHALTGAFFTATSMIGMIALAGIIVRNSILLVDFIQLAQDRGRSLREAVLEAGAVRFRPIALTAAAVVVGGIVMVLDPIFQGLAVALISGAIVATLLTMVVVPLLYWELQRTPGGND